MDDLQRVELPPQRIAVLAGGESAERKISLQSGAACAVALEAAGHCVVTVDPAIANLDRFDWSQIDVAFLALHGTFGEDGGVQQILERHGVTFTSSGSEASRLAFSKSAAKERFVLAGVPTPSCFVIHESDDLDEIAARADELGYPLVVKPDAQGSSIGVTIVRSPAELADAVSQCFYFDAYGLLENAVAGEEWTLGVIDDQPLPLIRIGTSHSFFDYEAKYEDDATQYEFVDNLDPALRDRLTETGLAACRALGTSGVARVDLILDEAGQPTVLEVNTIPGMTDHSLVPKAAAKIGLSMSDLCNLIVASALAAQKGDIRKAS
ncbi:D-alanine--D-alanine ligase [bacterium]|nr:D-alanine--D-alanine ligase [bacterium]